MFNSLSDRLSKTLQSMGKKARLTEDNIASTLKEVRKALVEADVALPVVKQFICLRSELARLVERYEPV